MQGLTIKLVFFHLFLLLISGCKSERSIQSDQLFYNAIHYISESITKIPYPPSQEGIVDSTRFVYLCSSFELDSIVDNSKLKSLSNSMFKDRFSIFNPEIDNLPLTDEINFNSKRMIAKEFVVPEEYTNRPCRFTFSNFVHAKNQGILYCRISLSDGMESVVLLYKKDRGTWRVTDQLYIEIF